MITTFIMPFSKGRIPTIVLPAYTVQCSRSRFFCLLFPLLLLLHFIRPEKENTKRSYSTLLCSESLFVLMKKKKEATKPKLKLIAIITCICMLCTSGFQVSPYCFINHIIFIHKTTGETNTHAPHIKANWELKNKFRKARRTETAKEFERTR